MSELHIAKHCCVKGCLKGNYNSNAEFYNFPFCQSPYVKDRREVWIQNIVEYCKLNKDWRPRKHSLICSDHFVGGKINDNLLHPAYYPTLFPIPEESKSEHKEIIINDSKKNDNNRITDHDYYKLPKKNKISTSMDFSCQVNILSFDSTDQPVNFMICNKMIENGLNCVETQNSLELKNDLKFLSKKSQTVDFTCISTIKSESDFLHMCGISWKVFNILLNYFPATEEFETNSANRLLMVLIKIKQGMSYYALSIIFGLSSQAIKNICLNTLKLLATKLKIQWLERTTDKSTWPSIFQRLSPNCKAILGCINVYFEIPDNSQDRNKFYDLYRNVHNLKFLIACAPNGIITYKSKIYFEENSYINLVKEHNFVDLIKHGDTVLTEGKFPNIQAMLDEKKVCCISLHLSNDNDLQALNLNIKECINRIKSFKILSSIPFYLLPYLEDVTNVCCCLINLEIENA